MTAPALPPPDPIGHPIDRWLFQLWQKVITNTVAGRLLATLGLTVSGDTFISRGITDNATTTALTLSGSAANSVTIDNSATNPKLGTSAGHLLVTPGGLNGLRVDYAASAVNYFSVTPSATGSPVIMNTLGSDTNINALWTTKGTGAFSFYTNNGGAKQFEVNHTASANRYITVTGSNGGDCTIGTSGGDLSLTSNIVNAPAYSNTTANAPNIYIDSNGKHYRSTFAVGGAVGGTVTSVGLAVPTGMSVSGTPVTGSGTITIALADDLAAVEALTTTGFVKRTASDTWSTAASIDLTADVTGDLPVTNLAGGTLDQGYSATPYNAGTKSSGTFTPDEANGNFQYCVNGGAFTLAPPTNNCTLVLQVTNNGSAGTITTSGFTKVSGYVPTTTNGDDFIAFITKINGFSHLAWQELQ